MIAEEANSPGGCLMKSGLGGMSSKHVRSSGVSDNLIYSTLLWKLGKGKRPGWAGLGWLVGVNGMDMALTSCVRKLHGWSR